MCVSMSIRVCGNVVYFIAIISYTPWLSCTKIVASTTPVCKCSPRYVTLFGTLALISIMCTSAVTPAILGSVTARNIFVAVKKRTLLHLRLCLRLLLMSGIEKLIMLLHLRLCLVWWLIWHVGEIWHVGDILIVGIVVTLIFVIFVVATSGIIRKTSICDRNKGLLLLCRWL